MRLGTNRRGGPNAYVPTFRDGLKQSAAALLDLIDQEGQQHQVHEHGTEVLVAVTEVVLEVIAEMDPKIWTGR